MGFLDPIHDTAYSDLEGLADPPGSIGRFKLYLLGILLPMVSWWCATDCWMSETFEFRSRGNSTVLTGSTAQAFALAVAFVGLFCCARWCLSHFLGNYGFLVGTWIALLGLGTSLVVGLYLMMA